LESAALLLSEKEGGKEKRRPGEKTSNRQGAKALAFFAV